jgi:hypothetical protein
VPLNRVWFLTYFCLYLFLYTSHRLYTYLFITSLVNSSQFIVHSLVNSLHSIVHRTIINFHINPFTNLPIYTSTHSHLNTTTTANILPQEGTPQGYYLYGGGGTLPVAIVFILFLCSIVRWSTTIVTFVTIATFVTSAAIATFISWVAQGHYLYGGKGCMCHPLKIQQGGYRGLPLRGKRDCHPYPLLVNGSRRL